MDLETVYCRRTQKLDPLYCLFAWRTFQLEFQILGVNHRSKDLPNMNTFCDWLSETIVISVYDSFLRNYIFYSFVVFYCLE